MTIEGQQLRRRPRPHQRHAAPSPRAGLRFAVRQLPLLAVAVAVYFGVRHVTVGDAVTATRNAEWIIDLERRLGIYVERPFQEWALGIDGVLQTVNTIYIWGHWPVITAVLGWLAWRHREAFIVYRNALLISGLVGMLIVATFPVAPPRLLDLGFLDTVTLHSEAYRVFQPPSFTNPYAAMPSFHFGWDLLMGIALAREAPRPWARMVGWALPTAMLLSVVITGNHFLLDAVAGGAIVLAALAAATRYQQYRHETTRSADASPPDSPRLWQPTCRIDQKGHP